MDMSWYVYICLYILYVFQSNHLSIYRSISLSWQTAGMMHDQFILGWSECNHKKLQQSPLKCCFRFQASHCPTSFVCYATEKRRKITTLVAWSPGRLFKSQPRPLVVPWMCVHWTQKHPPWFLGGCWWGWDFTESINNTSIAKAIGHIIHIDSKNACTGFSPNHEMSHQNNELCIYK